MTVKPGGPLRCTVTKKPGSRTVAMHDDKEAGCRTAMMHGDEEAGCRTVMICDADKKDMLCKTGVFWYTGLSICGMDIYKCQTIAVWREKQFGILKRNN